MTYASVQIHDIFVAKKARFCGLFHCRYYIICVIFYLPDIISVSCISFFPSTSSLFESSYLSSFRRELMSLSTVIE